MNQQHYFYTDNLKSARLTTQFLTVEDWKEWTAFLKDSEATQHFPSMGATTLEEGCKNWMNLQLQRYKDQHYGLQALRDQETSVFIGQCGLLRQIVDEQEEIEVGYHMLRKYWGNGYAPEAAKLFIDFAFKHHLAESIISIIQVENEKSQRVALKNGLQREKQTTWRGLDVYIYRILKEDFYN